MGGMRFSVFVLSLAGVWGLSERHTAADGKLFGPRDYQGSLEERSQEAIIVFDQGDKRTSSVEDLILKIRVVGPVEQFAWVVPLPNQPVTAREDPKLFEELFRYVEARRQEIVASKKNFGGTFGAAAEKEEGVEVLLREVVGSFDVAVVRERKRGALHDWLIREGYQGLENADDVIGYYRDKGYVFACVKVTDAAVSDLQRKDLPKAPHGSDEQKAVDLHPLRFTFETGGRDGIYFPMKMTGLQTEPFDVNLYIFNRAWINDRQNRYGYEHRGFVRQFRDWDTPKCTPNAGKLWSRAKHDPYLARHAKRMPTVVDFFKERHMDERFYLTNIQALGVKPDEVRRWNNDLWLFPYYVNRDFIPYDARPGGPGARTGAN